MAAACPVVSTSPSADGSGVARRGGCASSPTVLPSRDGHTALTAAALAGDLERISQLLADGADVAQGDTTGATALHWAAAEGQVAAAKALLEAGAPLDARTATNLSTPLHWAAEGGGPALVSLLLAANAAPDPQNKWKATPLAQAAPKRTDSVRALILAKADVANVDFMGYTPLHHACEQGALESAKLLVEAGAPLDVRDSVGITPLDVAREHDLRGCVALLEAAGRQRVGVS